MHVSIKVDLPGEQCQEEGPKSVGSVAQVHDEL